MVAIGLAAAVLLERDGDVIVGSFAADHVIRDAAAFRDVVREAVEVARAGYVATIGIAPEYPSTGFGYVHAGGSLGLPTAPTAVHVLSLIHISEPTRLGMISYAVFCLKKKKI